MQVGEKGPKYKSAITFHVFANASRVSSTFMKPEIWDDRKVILGEGPVSIGADNSEVLWVDILGRKVMSRNLLTGQIGEFSVSEDIGFVIPTTNKGYVLGTANGPILRDPEGVDHPLPTRKDADGFEDPIPMRWNDAKVAPDGHLFLGSMTYAEKTKHGALYRLDKDDHSLHRLLSDVFVSNGLGWNKAGDTFYYIDTHTYGIDAFDYHDGDISNRRTIWKRESADDGLPDGMCVDSEDGLWVAFWGGSCLRRLDNKFQVTEVIEFPAPNVTSCAFAGPDLDALIVTTASVNSDSEFAGKTYILHPGVKGVATTLFPDHLN